MAIISQAGTTSTVVVTPANPATVTAFNVPTSYSIDINQIKVTVPQSQTNTTVSFNATILYY